MVKAHPGGSIDRVGLETDLPSILEKENLPGKGYLYPLTFVLWFIPYEAIPERAPFVVRGALSLCQHHSDDYSCESPSAVFIWNLNTTTFVQFHKHHPVRTVQGACLARSLLF